MPQEHLTEIQSGGVVTESERGAMVTIRSETPEDIDAIRKLNETAFGQSAEADIVDRLREKRTAPRWCHWWPRMRMAWWDTSFFHRQKF